MNRWIYYGVANGIGVLFGTIFLIISLKKYKNSSYNEKLNPLKFLYILFILLEILKIFYHITYNQSLSPKVLSFAFCSNFLYVYPIICHTKENSMASRICKVIAVVPSLVIGTLYLFLIPKTYNLSTFSFVLNLHSRLYHITMLTGAIYMIVVKLCNFKFKDFYFSAISVCAYFIFCTVMSMALNTNIANYGPSSKQLGFLYNKVGYVVGNIFVCFVVFVIAMVIYGAIYITKKYAYNKYNKKID